MDHKKVQEGRKLKGFWGSEARKLCGMPSYRGCGETIGHLVLKVPHFEKGHSQCCSEFSALSGNIKIFGKFYSAQKLQRQEDGRPLFWLSWSDQDKKDPFFKIFCPDVVPRCLLA